MQYIFQFFLKTLQFLDSRKPPIPPPLTPLAGIIEADGWSYKKWFRVKVHFWKKCIKSGVSKASFCVPSWSSMKVQSWAFLRFGLFLWGHLIPSEGSILRFFAFWFVLVGPFDAEWRFSLSCFMLDGSQLSPQRSRKSGNFWLILEASPPEFFPFMKMDPQKKIFRCAARDLGAWRWRANARAARAKRAKRAMYLYTFFDLVFTASPKIALSCAFFHTPLARVEV